MSENTTCLFNIGSTYQAQQQFELALNTYQQLLEAEPEHMAGRYNRAIIYKKLGKIDQAIEDYNFLYQLYPEKIEVLYNLANCLVIKKKYSDAEALYRSILQYNSEHTHSMNNLAVIYHHQGKLSQAKKIFETIIQLDVNNLEAWNNLGSILKIEGDFSRAKSCFEQVLNSLPTHQGALCNLATLFYTMGKNNLALKYYQQLLTINPNHPQALHLSKALQENSAESMSIDYVADLFNGYAFEFEDHLVKKLSYCVPDKITQWLEDTHEKKIDSVLDLGCGTGLVGKSLCEKIVVEKIIGVDVSDNMINIARKSGIYSSLHVAEVLHFLKADLSSYQMIIGADLLPYFGDLTELFSLLKRKINTNSKIILSTEKNNKNKNFYLEKTARFSHALEYIIACAKQNKINYLAHQEIKIRDNGKYPAIVGDLIMLSN